MRPLVLDKIASVTANCRLAREVRIGGEIQCREGDVVAVRVASRKSRYDQLELTTGRFARVKYGDVIAGALGHRRALCGYAGHLPTGLAPGDRIDLLNLGGVLGVCTSENPEVGAPFSCEVLGQVLTFPYLGERIGVPANIAADAQPLRQRLPEAVPPVVAVVGTCMNSGKTEACTSLIQELVRRRMKVFAAKATGVSLRRDVLGMEDAGATHSAVFTDYGVVTTQRSNALALAQSMIGDLAEQRPDVIVLELGDGLLGDYGVDAILAAADIRDSFAAVILAAGDPVGAFGGVGLLAETYGISTTVVTGPATDNAAGTEVIERRLGVPARNARVSPEELANVVCRRIASDSESTRETEADHG